MSVTFSVCRMRPSVIKAHREANAFLRAFSLTSAASLSSSFSTSLLEWMATCRTGSRIYGIAHLWPTNPGLEFPKESSRVSPHVCCTDERGWSGVSFIPHQVFESTTVSPVPLRSILRLAEKTQICLRSSERARSLATWQPSDLFWRA